MHYVHRIFYLDLYQDHQKIKNCGYVKMEGYEDKTKFQFVIRKTYQIMENDIEVYITEAQRTEKIGKLSVQNNSIYQDIICPRAFQESDIYRIDLVLPNERRICFVQHKSKQAALQIKKAEVIPEEKQEEEKEVKVIKEVKQKPDPVHDEMKEIAAAEELPNIAEVKWEQLKNIYPMVHIFGEQTETILLKPQDLVILPEAYQSLATNSFLLHGYYNYRQLLLIKWQDSDEVEYFIGVPGTFHEREKNVAVLFGFESFENGESSRRNQQNEIYQGCFGYYLKRVEI